MQIKVGKFGSAEMMHTTNAIARKIVFFASMHEGV